MMESAGQQNKIQERVQGIFKRINREQIRNRVTTNLHKLLLRASSKLSFDSFTSAADSKTCDCVDDEQQQQENDGEHSRNIKRKANNVNDGDADDVNNEQKIMAAKENCSGELMPNAIDTSTTPRNKSPIQQWVDSLSVEQPDRRFEENPSSLPVQDEQDQEVENFTLGAEAAVLATSRPFPFVQISGCNGSDAGSHCSSMESLLEARKPDPEELLLELGFGCSEEPDTLSRIPSRFLQPSMLKGVAIDDFLKHQKLLVHTFQSGFSGYRGLTGPSHAMPSVIVGKIMDRLREAEVGRLAAGDNTPPVTNSPRLAKIANNLINKFKIVKEDSVLSADNRKWYQSQGDKSPEPTNKRIIIGHQSYTFSKDGNLIESPSNLFPRNGSITNLSGTESVQDFAGFIGIVNDDDNVEKLKKNEFLNQQIINSNNMAENSSNVDDNEIKLSAEEKNIVAGESDTTNESFSQEYKSMLTLVGELNEAEVTVVDIGTEENFCQLTPEQKKSLVINLIESALSTYQKRLRELQIRSHLKELLSGQLDQVTDLLHEAQPLSLITLIKQMTSLLRHQESLKNELEMHETQTALNNTHKHSIS